MKSCSIGAIVLAKELVVMSAALDVAIEGLEIVIRSDHVVNPKWATADDRHLEQERKRQMRQFISLKREIERLKGKGQTW